MEGFDLEQVYNVIVGSFGAGDFGRLLRFRFNINIREEVGNVGLKDAVTVILTKAEDEGWLPELIAAVAVARPRRPEVQAVYRKYAAALVSQRERGEVAAAYAKFFHGGPPVVAQAAGTTEAVVPVQDPGLERTVRERLGYLDAGQWSRRLAATCERVCRVELNDARGTMGTGFLVGPDALLTNYHVLAAVIDGPHPAAAVKFRFDYKTRDDGTPADGVLLGLADPNTRAAWLLGHGKYSAAEAADTPDAALPAGGELDYALVRLERQIAREPPGPGEPARGWVEVPTAQPALAGLPALLILQHPKKGPLQLAFDTDPNVRLVHGGLRVRYATNTEAGSSGSPCFDKDWKLVALHHYGDPAVGAPQFNQGVPIGLIREHLSDAGRAELGGRWL
jgi:hypothetical protein